MLYLYMHGKQQLGKTKNYDKVGSTLLVNVEECERREEERPQRRKISEARGRRVRQMF